MAAVCQNCGVNPARVEPDGRVHPFCRRTCATFKQNFPVRGPSTPCLVCGQQLQLPGTVSVFCSMQCHQSYTQPTAVNPQVQQQQIVQGTGPAALCQWCGTRPCYVDQTGTHPYCGKSCSQLAMRNSPLCVRCKTANHTGAAGKLCQNCGGGAGPPVAGGGPVAAGPGSPTGNNPVGNNANTSPTAQASPKVMCGWCSVKPVTQNFQFCSKICGRHSNKPHLKEKCVACTVNQVDQVGGVFCGPVCAQAWQNGTAKPQPPPPKIRASDIQAWIANNDTASLRNNIVAIQKTGKGPSQSWPHAAIVARKIDCLKVFVGDAKLDTRKRMNGQTALWLAAKMGDGHAIKYLLSEGANEHAMAACGTLPRDVAPPHEKKQFKNKKLPQENITQILASYPSPPPLFPNCPQATENLNPFSEEFQMISSIVNRSILNVHNSYQSNPYDWMDIKNIQRYYDAAQWAACMQEPQASTGEKIRYFLHGTSFDVCMHVRSKAFKQSTEGTFGPGVYMAENSSVAHLFAKIKPNPQKTNFMMLLAVNVGNLKAGQDQADMSNKKKSRDAVALKTAHTNCVENDSPKGYKEFVAFRVQRIYPAYLIEYLAVKKDGTAIPNPDP